SSGVISRSLEGLSNFQKFIEITSGIHRGMPGADAYFNAQTGGFFDLTDQRRDGQLELGRQGMQCFGETLHALQPDCAKSLCLRAGPVVLRQSQDSSTHRWML